MEIGEPRVSFVPLSHQCRAGYHILCRAHRAAQCACACHTTFDLASIAPRLALAHRQRRNELLAERAERRRARAELLALERLVAHRELQLVRAGFRDDGRYIARRTHKLARARQDLARLQAHAERIGAIPHPTTRAA